MAMIGQKDKGIVHGDMGWDPHEGSSWIKVRGMTYHRPMDAGDWGASLLWVAGLVASEPMSVMELASGGSPGYVQGFLAAMSAIPPNTEGEFFLCGFRDVMMTGAVAVGDLLKTSSVGTSGMWAVTTTPGHARAVADEAHTGTRSLARAIVLPWWI